MKNFTFLILAFLVVALMTIANPAVSPPTQTDLINFKEVPAVITPKVAATSAPAKICYSESLVPTDNGKFANQFKTIDNRRFAVKSINTEIVENIYKKPSDFNQPRRQPPEVVRLE